jgi:arsenate reductase
MNITVWYLSTCSTCLRILEDLDLDRDSTQLIDIKSNPLTEEQLEPMKNYVGSYKALINGRIIQFRTMDKKARDLNEAEAKQLLLQHYAFLKRPVFLVGEEYFVGNAKETVDEIKSRISHG